MHQLGNKHQRGDGRCVTVHVYCLLVYSSVPRPGAIPADIFKQQLDGGLPEGWEMHAVAVFFTVEERFRMQLGAANVEHGLLHIHRFARHFRVCVASAINDLLVTSRSRRYRTETFAVHTSTRRTNRCNARGLICRAISSKRWRPTPG